MSYEAEFSKWNKRYQATHYGYRDEHNATTVVAAQVVVDALILGAIAAGTELTTLTQYYYRFGDNARVNTILNTLYGGVNGPFQCWPRAGDAGYGPATNGTFPGTCLARRILARCSEDAWLRIVSVNPEYVRQSNMLALKVVTETSAPLYLFEKEVFLPSNEWVELYPTLGYACIFRADTIAGTLRLIAEGNVEGTE